MKKKQITTTLFCIIFFILPGGMMAENLGSDDLKTLANRQHDRFMRRVYDLQVKLWTNKGAAFVERIPGTRLKGLPAGDSLPGRHIQLHQDIIDAVQNMLRDARQALSLAQSAAVRNAQYVTDIRVRSGYRSARVQFLIWERHYPKYYRRTGDQRRTLPGGEHGEAAARFMADYINKRVFSPGYSPHQQGKTIDLTYKEKGVWAEADTSTGGIREWENSWLFSWLRQNAKKYGFARNPDINEPWHWEYFKEGQ